MKLNVYMIYALCVQYANYIYVICLYTIHNAQKYFCIHTYYMWINEFIEWDEPNKICQPGRRLLWIVLLGEREALLKEWKRKLQEEVSEETIHILGGERPTSYYPSDPRPCMLSETRKVAPGRAGRVFLGIGWVHVGSHRQQQTYLLLLRGELGRWEISWSGAV